MLISLKPYYGAVDFETVLDAQGLTDGGADTVTAKGKVTVGEDGKARAAGNITYEYVGRCDWCGNPFRRTVVYGFDEVFVKDPEDEDHYYYQGDKIDLSTMLRDTVVFSVPIKRMCADDCKGLCGQCGADLNKTVCNCEDITTEQNVSPFDVLKDFGGDK